MAEVAERDSSYSEKAVVEEVDHYSDLEEAEVDRKVEAVETVEAGQRMERAVGVAD